MGALRSCTGRFAGCKLPRTVGGPRSATISAAADWSFGTFEYGNVPTFIEAGYLAPGTIAIVLSSEKG